MLAIFAKIQSLKLNKRKRRYALNRAWIKMIYFDNSATTCPKPSTVITKACYSLKYLGGNPGRSGHKMSVRVANEVYKVREKIAQFFNAKPENVVFTLNCTHAVNFAMKGIMQSGGHMIISSLEHNAVSRPAFALEHNRRNVSVSVAKVAESNEKTIANFKALIRRNTKCICMMAASNVTGEILPFNEIAAICQKQGICFILDAAQGAGVMDIKLGKGINFICCAGHKGLYGLSGTGVLISDGKYPLSTIIEGGTGATSLELKQTDFLPEQLESGTINVPGIISLGAGVDFVKENGIDNIKRKEDRLCDMFVSQVGQLDNFTVIREDNKEYAPLVSFSYKNANSFEVTEYLSNRGFALRGGFHCSALAHKSLGTVEDGLTRFSPSVFNSEIEVRKVVTELKKVNNIGI